ncbi:hypothetical protein AC1031_010820 [Aphanomyces cochlioides]|nr:hypothetical protein AC1031_010820 [Aphanomyces cochlioides]
MAFAIGCLVVVDLQEGASSGQLIILHFVCPEMDKSAIVDDAADEAQYIEAADVQVAYKSLPLLQRVFVVLRPWWWRDTKPYFTLQEFSGAFGDLGNYFPFSISLAVTKQIAFGPTVFFSGSLSMESSMVLTKSLGLFNVMIAAYFDIPIPVLPLRPVSAVAIASKYSKTEIAAAGLLHGLVIFGLDITNLVTVVARYIPFCLVRGVQLGVGLQLLQNGVKQAYVHSPTISVNNKTHDITVKRSTDQLVWWGTDSIFVSIVLVLFCLTCMHRKGVPVALAVFIYGVIIAAINYHQMKGEWKLPDLSLGPDFSGMPDWPSHDDVKNAFVNMVLPQIPLSLLNGVLALEMLAKDYYPNHKAPPCVCPPEFPSAWALVNSSFVALVCSPWVRRSRSSVCIWCTDKFCHDVSRRDETHCLLQLRLDPCPAPPRRCLSLECDWHSRPVCRFVLVDCRS